MLWTSFHCLWALPTSRGEEGPHLASYSPSSCSLPLSKALLSSEKPELQGQAQEEGPEPSEAGTEPTYSTGDPSCSTVPVDGRVLGAGSSTRLGQPQGAEAAGS